MVWEQRVAPPNMAFQRTRRLASLGRSLCSLGSPLNAQPLGGPVDGQ
jgi:hypothetical protein